MYFLPLFVPGLLIERSHPARVGIELLAAVICRATRYEGGGISV
jgi:hypothetical protein